MEEFIERIDLSLMVLQRGRCEAAVLSTSFQDPAAVTLSANAGEFEIMAITAGEGNGWEFGEAVLRASLGLWEGVECFINHSLEGRSIRDLAGLCKAPVWDGGAKGIKLTLRAMGPSAGLLESLGREVLAAEGRKPKVGFSADVVFTAEGKRVLKIVRVNSLDLVYNPARGGAFVRALNAERGERRAGLKGQVWNLPLLPLRAVRAGIDCRILFWRVWICRKKKGSMRLRRLLRKAWQ